MLCAPFGSTYPKTGMVQRKWSQCKDNTQVREVFHIKKKNKNNKKNLPCSVPVSMVRRSSLYFENINENLMVGKIFSVLVVLCFVDLERTIRAVLS